MRKNRTKHEAKKPRLAKRALALCFALIFVCSCLLPVFAHSEENLLDTQGTVAAQQDEKLTNDSAPLNEGGEDSALLNEGGTNPTEGDTKPTEGGEEPKPAEQEPKTEETKPEGTTEESKGTTEESKGATEETKPEGTTGESKDIAGETKPEEPKTEETKPEEPKQPTTNTTGDTINQGEATYTYRFWPDKIDALDLEAINDAVKKGESLNDAAKTQVGMVPCTVLTVMTNAHLSDYSVTEPTKDGYEFAGWYTVDGTAEDKFSFEQNVIIEDEKSKTIDVFAKWNELVTLRETVDVVLGGEAVADEYSYDDDRMAAPTKTLTLDVEATNLSSNSKLSVSSTSSTDIDKYCENNELMPILTLDITPKDEDGNKTEPQKTSTVTISGLSELELPDKLTMVHKKDNGTIETIPAQYSNGTLTFEATSFSTYAVAVAWDFWEPSTSKQYVYVYLQVTGDTSGLVKHSNSSGDWFLIGRIPNVSLPSPDTGTYGGHKGRTAYKGKYQKAAVGALNKIERNGDGAAAVNFSTAEVAKAAILANRKINLKDVTWSTLGLTVANGADGFVYAGQYTWHLDGTLDVKFVDTYTINYLDKATGQKIKDSYRANATVDTVINIANDDTLKPDSIATEDGKLYKYDSASPTDCTITVRKDGTNTINLYYNCKVDPTDVHADDESFIAVEKEFIGITEDKIPSGFEVTVSGNGHTYTLTPNDTDVKKTPTDNGVKLRWVVKGTGTGTYTVKETGEGIDGYTVDKKGTGTVKVQAADFTVTTVDKETTCSKQYWPVKEADGKNFIFAASLTKNKGSVVISKKSLSAAQRARVEQAVLDLGGPFKKPVHFYSVDVQADAAGNFNTPGGRMQYDKSKGEIFIEYTSMWQHVATLSYNLTEAENPEIALTNTYKLNTLDIQITKQVNSGDRAKDFKFKVTSNDFSTTDNVSLTNRNGTSQKPQEWFYLKDGQSATLKGLKKDYTFTIEEEKENSADYDTTATENIAVEAGKTKSFRYKVVEENGKLVLQAVDEKTGTAVAGKNLIADGNVVVTNSVAATKLTVTKHVKVGNATAPSGAEFTFRLTVSNDVKVYSKVKLTKKGNDITESSVQSNKYQWEFKLKDTESVQITGIRIDDANVKVEEVGVDDTYYATTYSVNNGTAETGTTAEISTATLSANQAGGTTVDFTNTYNVPNLSSMTIKKVVTGAFGERTKEFAFSVTLENRNSDLLKDVTAAGAVTSKDDLGHFTMMHGGSVTLGNIPIGTTITVTETGADDYKTKATGHNGYVSGNNARTFTYTVVEEGGKAVLKSTGASAAEVANSAITVENNFDGTPDTGVLLDTLPYLILLAVAVAGGVLVVVRKRKHRDE